MKRFIVIAALFLLASCGPPQPHYETRYEMVPPPTQVGQYCATNCVSAQQLCKQNCSIASGQCSVRNEQEIDRRYQDYVAERHSLGRELKKDRYDFDFGDYQCTSGASSCEENCVSNFQQCYVSCGGQVIPHTVCTGNCHLAPPNYPRY